VRTRIKICCIPSVVEARTAIDAGADALGLVARMPSGPGPISDELIADVAAFAPPPISTFLLTSETTADGIAAHVAATNPTTVQVVSHIDPAEAERLAGLIPHVRRVQVIHIEGMDALAMIPAYSPHIHAFLLDSGKPNAAVPELGGAQVAPMTGP
jgi:phosphoribosylanthranilate isomerase